MPTFGGGGGGSSGGGFGGIWGAEPATPGPAATWSESTRLLVAVGAFALVALAAGLLIFGIVKGGKAKPAGAPAVAVQVTKFVPQTAAQGGKTQLTVTFTDGTTADILYDSGIGLAGLGVTPLDSGALNQFARAGRQFQIDHGAATFVLNESPTPAPSALPGAQASTTVTVLPAVTPTPGNFLNFRFGDWRVGVWEGTGDDHMTAADDQAWASNLAGTVTPSGFLVLAAKPPLKMTPFGAAGGPALLFGDIFTTGVLLTPTSCVPPAGANVVQNASGVPVSIAKTAGEHYEGDLCLKGQKMDFELFGTQQFVKSATDSIEVRNLKPGPSRG